MDKKNKSLEFLFEQARKQNIKIPLESVVKTLERKTDSAKKFKTIKGNGSLLNFKTISIMITGMSVLFILSWVYNPSENQDKFDTNQSQMEESESKQIMFLDYDSSNISDMNIESVEIKSDTVYQTKVSYKKGSEVKTTVIAKKNNTIRKKIDKNQYVQQKNEIPEIYVFPSLSEENIKDINKEKSKMLKQLLKKDRKKYVFIPSKSSSEEGNETSIASFWMRSTEVTVLEYRTFLGDLLIQGKKAEFLLACPEQDLWEILYASPKTANHPIAEHYFFHTSYNDYPVNNISTKGAELYCKWLSNELIKKYGKEKTIDIGNARIPTENEWMQAAYGGSQKKNIYPWDGNSTQNEKGYYRANYAPTTKNDAGEIVEISELDGGLITVKVDSYKPNNFGLYNMSGNLAEMVVLDKNIKVIAVKGGGWRDGYEKLIIDSKPQNIGETKANVNVGFRPVFTFIK